MKLISSAASRKNTRYTGNLSVFTQQALPEQAPDTGKAAHALVDPVAGRIAKATRVSEASNDAKPRKQAYGRVAAGVVLALTTGAVVGGAYTSNSVKHNASAKVELPVTAPEIIEQPTQLVETTEAVSEPVADAESLAELNEMAKLNELYLDEIQWLHTQNTSLKGEVDTLYVETAEMNKELLDLELALVARQSQPQAPVAIKTVYNYVDVPVGGGTVETTSQANDYSSDAYAQDAYSQDAYSQTDNNVYSEEFDYDSDNSIGNQLIFDPETGFYTNVQYSADSDAPRNSPNEYPPSYTD